MCTSRDVESYGAVRGTRIVKSEIRNPKYTKHILILICYTGIVDYMQKHFNFNFNVKIAKKIKKSPFLLARAILAVHIST